jgi:hypothetical protein
MNVESIIADLVNALHLPASAKVDQRVPKKLLSENGAPTAADKRTINDGIEELMWLAALKPNTVGVPDYRDDAREYVEIAILQLTLRAGAKAARLIELTHRAVPYPVLLVTARTDGASVSAGHKRWSQGEAGKTVVEGEIFEVNLGTEMEDPVASAFRDALALSRQPCISLYALYQGWIDVLLTFHAARKTGRFVLPDSPVSAAARREALMACTQLEAEIARLRLAATREKQMTRQITLNLEVKRVESELAAAKSQL